MQLCERYCVGKCSPITLLWATAFQGQISFPRDRPRQAFGIFAATFAATLSLKVYKDDMQ